MTEEEPGYVVEEEQIVITAKDIILVPFNPNDDTFTEGKSILETAQT